MSTTIELNIETTFGITGYFFTISLTEKTSFTVSLDGVGVTIYKNNQPSSLGRPFYTMGEALGHYKNSKMLAALRAIPDYIASGLTGPQAVQV